MSCFFIVLNIYSYGQKYNVLNFSTADGLPAQIVNDAFQDRDGYFWFATQSGVSRFNGHEFSDFAPVKSLNGIDAVSIIQDAQGRICIGTNTAGLFIYDYKKTINFSKNKGLASNTIRKLYLDKKNTLWVLTSGGVYQMKNDQVVAFKDPKNIFNSGVLSMTETKNGDLYFGTQGYGLVKVKAGKFTYFNASDGILDDYIFSLNSNGDSLLIGTTNQGVIIGYKEKFTQINIEEIKTAWISAILMDDKGMHVISSNGLVNIYRNGNYDVITENNGLASNDLYNGYYDREHNLWLTSGNGLSCLRKEQIISLDKETGLSNEKITCLTRLSNNNIAVGTYGSGINIIDNQGRVKSKIYSAELENVKITCIAEIPKRKELWIGTEQSKGVIIIDLSKEPYTIKYRIHTIDKVPLQTITKIEQDKNNTIWVGTFNAGLFRLANNDTLNYNSKNGLPSNEVYTFILDKKGIPWVSIYQKGLYKLENKVFKHIFDKKSFNDRFILSIDEDAFGNMYFGTKTNGLSILKKGEFNQLTIKDGLLSNAIQAIEWSNNQLWVGTNRGINQLVKLENGKYKIITYDQRSGLTNVETQQNALLSAGNSLWVGTSSGLSRINADKSHYTSVKPLIRLQSIKLFFNDVDWDSKKGIIVNKEGLPTKLELSYKENHLSFNFNALTTSSVFYTYYLEGQDDKWTPLSDKRDVTFSNLNPGEYTFKVKAVDNFGIESDVLEIPIIINSPYYQTWWFRILSVTLLGLIVIAFIRIREKNYRERQIVLENTVQERTKEVVQKNKEILDSISYAKRIQSAMLPSEAVLKSEFKDIFVFYQPKDIVAGDFYWFEKINDKLLIAVADCTGHGVPGAMISVVCNNALNRVIREYGIAHPASILDKTRELILLEFSKYQDEVTDGMDISLALIDPTSNTLEWAGANNSLWMLPKNETVMLEIKGDKQPVGKHINTNSFTNHLVQLSTGTMLYFLSDGFSDQFGGPKGKKMKSAGLKEILISIADRSLEEQQIALKTEFEKWRGEQEQVDDVCVIGIRI